MGPRRSGGCAGAARASRVLVALVALVACAAAARADVVVAENEIVQGNICVGFDCIDGEVFGTGVLLLKENNTRLMLDDTSAPGLPDMNWQVRANNNTSGGPSYLAIMGGDTAESRAAFPFAVGAGAPANALLVDAAGRVGVKTGTPDPGAALTVAGDLRIAGDLQVTGGAQSGVVPPQGFVRRSAAVTFGRPYSGDYVVLLTSAHRRAGAICRPTVLGKTAAGFTFTCGGAAPPPAVFWTTRLVGEY